MLTITLWLQVAWLLWAGLSGYAQTNPAAVVATSVVAGIMALAKVGALLSHGKPY